MNDRVHQSHCCVVHGCKYNDEDCPVVAGKIHQLYLCETCPLDGIDSLILLHQASKLNKLGLTHEDVEALIDLIYESQSLINQTGIVTKLTLIQKAQAYHESFWGI